MTREIILTQGKVALVDDEDYSTLSKYKWCAHKQKNTFYAVRQIPDGNGKQKQIKMHMEIAGTPKGLVTDHINGDGLDNRRVNLRIVTKRQNSQNRHHKKTSKYPGVSFRADLQKWQAYIKIESHQKHLGYFDDEEAAYHAYCGACALLGVEVLQ